MSQDRKACKEEINAGLCERVVSVLFEFTTDLRERDLGSVSFPLFYCRESRIIPKEPLDITEFH